MKILVNNTIIKKILIVLVTIIMVNSFIMPNYVNAEDEPGGVLFTPITELLLRYY